MPKILVSIMLSVSLILGSTAFSEEKVEKKESPNVAKLSEALGHMIGKNLLDTGVKLDLAQVIKGLKDSNQGKESPLSENECVAAISSAQENVFKEKANQNLREAEIFLKKQCEAEGIVTLEEGKIHYKIDQEGAGSLVEAHSTPLVKYSGKFLDGKEFGSSKTEEAVALDELIPGLKIGLIGMKEGEKRTVYIHPSLGYGTAGMLPPNSLLCFEVEVIKAQTEENSKSEITTKSVGEELLLDEEKSSAEHNSGDLL